MGEFLVAEADESDGSFLKLSPVLEIVTNIDLEHLDYYRDLDQIKATFLEFIEKVPFYGAAILCLDDVNITDILPRIRKRTITYGLTSQADVYAEQISFEKGKVHFVVKTEGRILGEVAISRPGRHNVYNSLAVICAGRELEIPFPVIKESLESFAGVQRRLQVKGEVDGITVIDDYGHHPTEIKATLDAIKQGWPERRLVVLFQPHRYTRTKGLFKEFLTAFHQADFLVLTEIYAASEKPIEGISAEGLLNEIKMHGQRHTHFVRDVKDMAAEIAPLLKRGDLVVTLGAGNIVNVGDLLLDALRRGRPLS